MGMVIEFPDVCRNVRTGGADRTESESADVIILPVVRIDRQPEASSADDAPKPTPPNRRRRPASRS